MIFLTHVRVEVVVSFSFVQAMPFICACVYIYMLVLVSNTHNHFIILHSHSEPYTQREKKKNERKQSLFGGDCHTSHICCYVSSLKSCIRSWHEQFHLRLLQTGYSNHLFDPFHFLLRMVCRNNVLCIYTLIYDLLHEYIYDVNPILAVGKLHLLCPFGPSARFSSFLSLGMSKYRFDSLKLKSISGTWV